MQLEKKPLQGFLVSLIVGIATVFIGAILSIIIIGIPILGAGVLIVLASPVLAFFVKFGECPNCQNKLYLITDNVKCRKCKMHLMVIDNVLEVA